MLLQYNWYNKASISHILQLDPITSGSVLITAKIVALKRKNAEPILTVKIIEWRKFIEYFGLSIEANSSTVDKYIYICLHISYIPIR